MPTTRAASKEQTTPHVNFAKDIKNRPKSVAPEEVKATRQPPDSEIIVIDDSDDENPPPRKKKKRAVSRIHSSSRTKSLEEISSGPDDGVSLNYEKTIKNLQEQVKSLRHANTQLQNRLMWGKEESGVKDAKIAQLTADIDSMKRTNINVLPELEDHITCEICVMKMWSPYTLPGCGHTFCQSCLEDWFNSTLAKHLQDHPNYRPNAPIPPHLMVLAHHDPRIRAEIEALRGPKPRYTCPSCRAPVKSKPVEVYALKKVTRTAAKALGESSPQRVLPARGEAHAGSSWDGFFP